MKITFTTPIIEEDVTRTGVTIDHLIVYPGAQIVINNKGGSSKSLPMDGLSKPVLEALQSLLSVLASDIEGEYATKLVTLRASEKTQAAEVVKPEGVAVNVKK